MKRNALLSAVSVVVLTSLGLVSCGGYSTKLTTRVLASQSVASPTAQPGLLLINGANDTLQRGGISAGTSPGLMTLTPNRSTLIAFDAGTNSVGIVNTQRQSSSGSIPLAGSTTSMVALASGNGYAAVPAAPMNSQTPPGAVVVMNLATATVVATVSVPNAQTVVSSPGGSQILVFSSDSDVVTILSPSLSSPTGIPVTTTVPGFDRPVYAVFSADGSTAYILNCGPQCGSGTANASVQTLNMTTLALGTPLVVDAATIGWLNGSTLYVVGTSPTNNSCTGQNTAAATCGRLDLIDLGSMTVTSSVVITDGYHNRIDMSSNGQLFIGSFGCTTVGDVHSPQGEVRGCLSIFNTTNSQVVIPPDNGDVTGFQSFTTRDVEYVAEGGNLRVYDTLIDSLLPHNDFLQTGTIIITGQIIDVKAIDFF